LEKGVLNVPRVVVLSVLMSNVAYRRSITGTVKMVLVMIQQLNMVKVVLKVMAIESAQNALLRHAVEIGSTLITPIRCAKHVHRTVMYALLLVV